MKTIKLTQGKVALVDDCDYEYLNQWKWNFNKGFAARLGPRRYGQKPFRVYYTMQREVLRRALGHTSFEVANHINRNRLDNRVANLRGATQLQSAKSTTRSGALSGFRGVHWKKTKKRWGAGIVSDGVRVYLGSFINLIDAVRARKVAEQKYHGEFAATNGV